MNINKILLVASDSMDGLLVVGDCPGPRFVEGFGVGSTDGPALTDVGTAVIGIAVLCTG